MTGPLDLTITVHTTLEVDALSARRRAAGWLVSEVGNLLLGGDPASVVAERTVWRVPVLLTSLDQGVVGEIGSVDVDATMGEVLYDASLIQELRIVRREGRSESPSQRA